ncbi:hypothetical protein M8818_005751 [Zalaria obscura]|uniref:Uncharacterized protein n=1 Tax=Zalaria obscura TaxID=2024903 RepID=A0ACC3S8V4_9PEZI
MSLPATLDMRQHGSSPSDMETEQGPTDQTRDGRHTVRDKHDSGFTLSTTETKLEKENDNNDPGSVTDSQTFDQKRIVDWDGPDDPDHPLNCGIPRQQHLLGCSPTHSSTIQHKRRGDDIGSLVVCRGFRMWRFRRGASGHRTGSLRRHLVRRRSRYRRLRPTGLRLRRPSHRPHHRRLRRPEPAHGLALGLVVDVHPRHRGMGGSHGDSARDVGAKDPPEQSCEDATTDVRARADPTIPLPASAHARSRAHSPNNDSLHNPRIRNPLPHHLRLPLHLPLHTTPPARPRLPPLPLPPNRHPPRRPPHGARHLSPLPPHRPSRRRPAPRSPPPAHDGRQPPPRRRAIHIRLDILPPHLPLALHHRRRPNRVRIPAGFRLRHRLPRGRVPGPRELGARG